MRARHRLSKLLLRHDVRFDGPARAWTVAHRDWLGRVDLGGPAQLTLLDYLGAIDALIVRRDTLEGHLERLVPDSPWAKTVARLRCLRGIDTLSAVGLCAWHYRRAPAKGVALRRRQSGQDPHVLAISWQAQQRLHRTWRRLDHERGKRSTIVAVACARELAGFCWAWRAPTELRAHHVGQGGGRSTLAAHAREHPRRHYEQPLPGPRSILDRGLSRRNPVLR